MDLERTLTLHNVQALVKRYTKSIENIGVTIEGMKGLTLIQALKREKVGSGPYPKVTIFEAANRIMTDLVILHGVRWLLKNRTFPFDAYEVEFGNEDKNDFDLRASGNGRLLVGEAFNVAPSFYQGKKLPMLKKLRKETADYRVVMVNHDAVTQGYSPLLEDGLYYVFVNVAASTAKVVPNTGF